MMIKFYRQLIQSIMLLTTLFMLLASSAQAQLHIDISGVGDFKRYPIAIANFSGDAGNSKLIVDTIRSDLEKSGFFRLIDPGAAPLPEDAVVNYLEWRAKEADYVVIGSLLPGKDGRMEARFRLYNISSQTQLTGMSFGTTPQSVRRTGHRIADMVYESIMGEKGAFSTQIAYVSKKDDRYQLLIGEWDGLNAQSALISKEPIISPTWSPDGSRIAYVSFENKKPVIYIHTLATGRRQVLANFKGSNSAPAWSPDGSRLAIALSRDGNTQIYLISANGTGVTRLTKTNGIDTEPVFAPDGKTIYFTSDRGGGPQIYKMPVSGGAAERVTFNGNYNISPRISPDGKFLAYITRSEGRFQLMLMDLEDNGSPIALSSTSKDESPSFSPNSRLILYATQIDGRSVLAIASRDGRVKQRLNIDTGDAREPTWGPYLN